VLERVRVVVVLAAVELDDQPLVGPIDLHLAAGDDVVGQRLGEAEALREREERVLEGGARGAALVLDERL
jgi:hypothetical protein